MADENAKQVLVYSTTRPTVCMPLPAQSVSLKVLH